MAVDRSHLRPVDGKNIAVSGVRFRVSVGVLQDLYLDAAVKGLAARGDVIGPDEDPPVAPRLHVTPLDFQDEVLVHAVGA